MAEAGVIVQTPARGDGHIVEGFFPSGNYISITHTGDYKHLMEAHMGLESWISNAGLKEKQQISADGIEWGSRTEFYLTDEQKEPNPDRWQTEVVFLLEDEN